MMFNDVGFISLKFGTLESAVVRRWALDFLEDLSGPPPAEEQPDAQMVDRTITLEASRREANGTVSSDFKGGEVCTQSQVVRMQRSTRKGKWRTISETTTDDSASFTFKVTKAGTYRALAPAVRLDEQQYECQRTFSDDVKVT
jgi:hypothetical protein